MIKGLLKRIAAKFPARWRQGLKRRYFGWQIGAGRFRADEPEFPLLDRYIRSGDWVLDVGANVGHYTVRLSELVGPSGRVIAFEPVTDTFELLAANMGKIGARNVTLMNAAVSETTSIAGMSMPKFDTGLDNYYMAQLVAGGGDFSVLCIPVDALELPRRVSLIKIDAEGHEMSVIRGMQALLRRDQPVLIVEDNVREVASYLRTMGYSAQKLEGSSNQIFLPVGDRRPRTERAAARTL